MGIAQVASKYFTLDNDFYNTWNAPKLVQLACASSLEHFNRFMFQLLFETMDFPRSMAILPHSSAPRRFPRIHGVTELQHLFFLGPCAHGLRLTHQLLQILMPFPTHYPSQPLAKAKAKPVVLIAGNPADAPTPIDWISRARQAWSTNADRDISRTPCIIISRCCG